MIIRLCVLGLAGCAAIGVSREVSLVGPNALYSVGRVSVAEQCDKIKKGEALDVVQKVVEHTVRENDESLVGSVYTFGSWDACVVETDEGKVIRSYLVHKKIEMLP